VKTREEVKSVGKEHTFGEDTRDAERIATTLMRLCESVAYRLRKKGMRGRTVTLKLRYADFTTITRSETVQHPMAEAPRIYRVAWSKLDRARLSDRQVRLVGVSVSELETGPSRQTSLFEKPPDQDEEGRRQKLLNEAIDRIKERFGEGALRRGRSLEGRSSDDAE
jgi:nucleotidyltransferase/DNA polymerase involved in DNA repair